MYVCECCFSSCSCDGSRTNDSFPPFLQLFQMRVLYTYRCALASSGTFPDLHLCASRFFIQQNQQELAIELLCRSGRTGQLTSNHFTSPTPMIELQLSDEHLRIGTSLCYGKERLLLILEEALLLETHGQIRAALIALLWLLPKTWSSPFIDSLPEASNSTSDAASPWISSASIANLQIATMEKWNQQNKALSDALPIPHDLPESETQESVATSESVPSAAPQTTPNGSALPTICITLASNSSGSLLFSPFEPLPQASIDSRAMWLQSRCLDAGPWGGFLFFITNCSFSLLFPLLLFITDSLSLLIIHAMRYTHRHFGDAHTDRLFRHLLRSWPDLYFSWPFCSPHASRHLPESLSFVFIEFAELQSQNSQCPIDLPLKTLDAAEALFSSALKSAPSLPPHPHDSLSYEDTLNRGLHRLQRWRTKWLASRDPAALQSSLEASLQSLNATSAQFAGYATQHQATTLTVTAQQQSIGSESSIATTAESDQISVNLMSPPQLDDDIAVPVVTSQQQNGTISDAVAERASLYASLLAFYRCRSQWKLSQRVEERRNHELGLRHSRGWWIFFCGWRRRNVSRLFFLFRGVLSAFVSSLSLCHCSLGSHRSVPCRITDPLLSCHVLVGARSIGVADDIQHSRSRR